MKVTAGTRDAFTVSTGVVTSCPSMVDCRRPTGPGRHDITDAAPQFRGRAPGRRSMGAAHRRACHSPEAPILDTPRTPTMTRPRRADASRGGGPVASAVVVVLTVAVAVITGVQVVTGGSRDEITIPLAVVGGLGLVALALTRFDVFVLATLAIRATVDWSKAGARTFAGVNTQPGKAASALAVLFGAAGVAWLLARRRRGTRPPESSLIGPFVVFLGAITLSLISSANRRDSLSEIGRVAAVV